MGYYKLDADDKVIAVTDAVAWNEEVKAEADSSWVIASDRVGDVIVETFFRGYDNDALIGQKQPELWRTRIGPVDVNDAEDWDVDVYPKQLRYRSEKDAIDGHAVAVAGVQGLKL